jgi:hypothetical protein
LKNYSIFNTILTSFLEISLVYLFNYHLILFLYIVSGVYKKELFLFSESSSDFYTFRESIY